MSWVCPSSHSLTWWVSLCTLQLYTRTRTSTCEHTGTQTHVHMNPTNTHLQIYIFKIVTHMYIQTHAHPHHATSKSHGDSLSSLSLSTDIKVISWASLFLYIFFCFYYSIVPFKHFRRAGCFGGISLIPDLVGKEGVLNPDSSRPV